MAYYTKQFAPLAADNFSLELMITELRNVNICICSSLLELMHCMYDEHLPSRRMCQMGMHHEKQPVAQPASNAAL